MSFLRAFPLVRMIELNKGIRVGGPFDGKIHSVLFYPGEYPNDEPPLEVAEISRVLSINFPEGAIYHWHKEKQEWHYVGQMDEESQDAAKQFFGVFQKVYPDKKLKPADPL